MTDAVRVLLALTVALAIPFGLLAWVDVIWIITR